MNAIVRVALQFVKCRSRYRRSLTCLAVALIVTASVFLYVSLLCTVPKEYVVLNRDLTSVQRPENVNSHSSVVRKVPLNVETQDERFGSSLSTTKSCVNHQNETDCKKRTIRVDDIPFEGRNDTLRTSNTPVQTLSNLSHSPHESHLSSSLIIKGVLPRVLVLYDNFSVDSAKRLKVFLQAQRIDFDLYSSTKNKTPPPLSKFNAETDEVIGRYALILCADIGILFRRLGQAERRLFHDYSREFNVSIVAMRRTGQDLLRGHVESSYNYGRYLVSSVKREFMSGVVVDNGRPWVYVKGGVTVTRLPSNAHWQVFTTTQETQNTVKEHHGNSSVHNEVKANHLSLEYIQKRVRDKSVMIRNVLVNLKYAVAYPTMTDRVYHTSPLVLVDDDIIPGTTTILIGMDVHFWLTKLILFDVFKTYARSPLLRFDNRRWVMVDIDDIFIAPQGLRMTTNDVEALISAQGRYQRQVPGFKFNLGFCGYYYDRGMEVEQLGNQRLVKNKNLFNWFGHMYNHYQPHNCSEEKLVDYMTRNKQFAAEHGIPIPDKPYSVSPHHSGIYPIHQPLYNAWRRVWNVSMTTTEEYPHIYPFQLRRGFIHQGVMVLPRQTCQLYTHTYSNETFKGGKAELANVAEGGSVFNTILYNPVNVFMTHVTNYAVDRLALELFDKLFTFVREWTNIQLVSDSPLTLGRKYFEIFPEDKTPFWTSPCLDKRHLEIWSSSKNCSRLPSVLVIGPQKSGTTALHTFLRIHPNISSNHQTKDHFEEVQFFSNSTLYLRGIEWYMEQFPVPKGSQVLFEKSATYFSNPLVPQRAYSLLPKAKLVAILHDPVKRAYSWYQHMLAHKDPTALAHSFSEVIRASPQTTDDKKLLTLRDHCLSPGRYHIHLSKWLKYYSYKQLYLVDGGELVSDPASVMARLQLFLPVERRLNYSKILSYSEKKGFHCLSVNGKFHCLGPSKGRQYPEMESADEAFLRDFYRRDNLLLRELLKRFSYRTPTWLMTSS